MERSDLLTLPEYVVELPDQEAKLAIAQRASGGADSGLVLPLLEAAAWGLEARIVGQLGRRLTVETSRYGLFDAYIRTRLGPDASDGLKALSRIAGTMFDRLSFGLSAREGASISRSPKRRGLSARRTNHPTIDTPSFRIARSTAGRATIRCAIADQNG